MYTCGRSHLSAVCGDRGPSFSPTARGAASFVRTIPSVNWEWGSKSATSVWRLVTPTHYVPQILAALELAISQGLSIPLVYNTSGYESLETLRLLDGIVDIYLPDSKYADDAVARRLSGFEGYVTHNRLALLEMQRQVGEELLIDADGIAIRGMIVRHLVLPGGFAQTPEVLTWIAEHLSRRSAVSLMAQYFPAHKAVGHAALGRRLSLREYSDALEAYDRAGLENGWRQELDPVY